MYYYTCHISQDSNKSLLGIHDTMSDATVTTPWNMKKNDLTKLDITEP